MGGDNHEYGGGTETVTYRVATKIANREGIEPLELSPPLFEAIDPEVLEALVSDTSSRERREDIYLQFPYYGYVITVKGNGEVDISTDESASL